MPDARVAAAAAGDGQQAQQPRGAGFMAGLGRMMFFWMIMSYMRGNPSKSADPASVSRPLLGKGQPLDLYFFINEQPELRGALDRSQLTFQALGVDMVTYPERTETLRYTPSAAAMNNGTVFMHILGSLVAGAPLPASASDETLSPDAWFVRTHPLTHYMLERKEETGVSLLSGDAAGGAKAAGVESAAIGDGAAGAAKIRKVINYWKPNMTVNLVEYLQPTTLTSLPPQVSSHFRLHGSGAFYPLVVPNEFWLLKDRLEPLNESTPEVSLALTVKPLSFWWWQLQLQMEQSFSLQQATGLTQEGESDDFKRVLIEGNPYLLAITFCVSLLHTAFDFLAFKNDIGFWKNNKSMEGLAARSIVINAGCQLVIFLYLLDSETSFVVLLSSGVGTAIELWKVTKAMNVSIDRSKFPYLIIKGKESAHVKDTDKHDAEATRYLSYALYPLVIGYAIYSLVYKKHKSWYSWVLSSLVGAVYMFGFILMCPQLYLNYKLKSVAHLPWRQMTYKFLNTIIDDLFAFVITMPTLHRLSVFRDDIVFLIFLYQRWIYRVDKTRVNEFGFSGQDTTAAVAAAAAAAPAIGAPDEPPAVAAASAAGGEGKEAVRQRKAGAKGSGADGGGSSSGAATAGDDSKKGK